MHKVVHHVDGHTDRFRPRQHRGAHIAGARAEDRNHPCKIRSQGIATGKLDPRRVRSLQATHMMMAIGGVPANARARRRQQAQFRPREVAGSDQKHGTGLQIEKYRQESHAAPASPTYGVDWNYFLYMSRSAAAKRKLFLLRCGATIEFSPQ